MVIIGRINQFKRDDCDFTLAIVRSFKSSSDWIQQVPQLSPSPELFRDYVRVWKPSGRWNHDTFENEYVPRFLHQIANDPQALQWLNWVYQQDKAGKTVGLACFCTDETLCHRSIIAGLLQGVGANVRTTKNADYSHYFEQFRNIQAPV